MPAGCCGCGDPPANPLGRRWLALRPCGAGSAPSGPGGSGSHRSRGSLGSPRDQLRACPAPPRPSRLRRARGLSCGLARGSCPRVPSGPLPTCPRALPLTSWKHPLPLPPPRRPGRRAPAAAAAPGGGGAGAAQAPPVGRRGRQSSAAVPPPVPLVGVPCQQERALGRTGPVCWLSLLPGSFLPRSCLRGAAARGPWRGRPASRRCGAQVGVRRRDAMGRDGTSWRERCGRAGAPRDGTGRAGERQPANSAHEKSVALALSKRLSRPAGSEGAHGCRPGRGRADRRLLPGQRLSRRAPPASSRRPRGLRPRCHSPTRLFRSDSQVRHLPCSGTVLLRGLFPCWCAPCGTEPERIPGEPGRTGHRCPGDGLEQLSPRLRALGDRQAAGWL